MKIVLASGSPRRKELLQNITKGFIVVNSCCEEVIPEGMPSEEVPEYLARLKANSVAQHYPQDAVIGADTVVIVQGELLGKPATAEEAKQMLKKLSGSCHSVVTGVAVVAQGKCSGFSSTTEVWFAEMTEEEIDWYISTGEPFDKAGAYGIQGYGSLFIEKISGDFFTVMGLPVQKLYSQLVQICPQQLEMVEKYKQ